MLARASNRRDIVYPLRTSLDIWLNRRQLVTLAPTLARDFVASDDASCASDRIKRGIIAARKMPRGAITSGRWIDIYLRIYHISLRRSRFVSHTSLNVSSAACAPSYEIKRFLGRCKTKSYGFVRRTREAGRRTSANERREFRYGSVKRSH